MTQKRKFYTILLPALILLLAITGCGGYQVDSDINSASDSTDTDITTDTDTDTDPTNSASLTWDPPTTNEDGTSLTDLAGYKIYYGISSGNYTDSIDVGDITTFSIDNIPLDTSFSSVTWCFAVIAYDTSLNESDYSNEVCTDI